MPMHISALIGVIFAWSNVVQDLEVDLPIARTCTPCVIFHTHACMIPARTFLRSYALTYVCSVQLLDIFLAERGLHLLCELPEKWCDQRDVPKIT